MNKNFEKLKIKWCDFLDYIFVRNKWLNKKVEALNSIDPYHFDINDIKKLYSFSPMWFLKHICKMTVRQKLYLQHTDENDNIYYSLNTNLK